MTYRQVHAYSTYVTVRIKTVKSTYLLLPVIYLLNENVLRFDCLVLNKLAIGKAETNLVSALPTANLISCGTKEHTVCYCNCNMGVLSAFSITFISGSLTNTKNI